MSKQTMTNEELLSVVNHLLKDRDMNKANNYDELGVAQLMDEQGADYFSTHAWLLEDGSVIIDTYDGADLKPACVKWPGIDEIKFSCLIGMGVIKFNETESRHIWYVESNGGEPSGYMYSDEAGQMSFPWLYASVKAAKIALDNYIKHNL